GEANAGVDTDGCVSKRRDRDGCPAAGRGDLDPTLAVAERQVTDLLEAKCLGVERERPLLVAGRDGNRRDLRDRRRMIRHGHPPDRRPRGYRASGCAACPAEMGCRTISAM